MGWRLAERGLQQVCFTYQSLEFVEELDPNIYQNLRCNISGSCGQADDDIQFIIKCSLALKELSQELRNLL